MIWYYTAAWSIDKNKFEFDEKLKRILKNFARKNLKDLYYFEKKEKKLSLGIHE